mmetsp:Transcript_30083/g.82625  ORF Transcript_30083/g.82625 Transcript_30083/m.82625 type:complete len:220 (-) Transcript_30083:35-694(-)
MNFRPTPELSACSDCIQVPPILDSQMIREYCAVSQGCTHCDPISILPPTNLRKYNPSCGRGSSPHTQWQPQLPSRAVVPSSRKNDFSTRLRYTFQSADRCVDRHRKRSIGRARAKLTLCARTLIFCGRGWSRQSPHWRVPQMLNNYWCAQIVGLTLLMSLLHADGFPEMSQFPQPLDVVVVCWNCSLRSFLVPLPLALLRPGCRLHSVCSLVDWNLWSP